MWTGAAGTSNRDVTYVHAGTYKVEGNGDAPLDKELRADMQRHVDRYDRMFAESVARNRGMTVERGEGEFGQGRIVGAQDAVPRGMADRLRTFKAAVREVGGRISGRERIALRRRKVFANFYSMRSRNGSLRNTATSISWPNW